MKIEIHQAKGESIAEFIADEVLLRETQDALDLMAEASQNNCNKMMLYEKNIDPAFFDLKTGVAGDILQKFSNYRMQLAVVGNFVKFNSKSLADFMLESNQHGQVNFVATREEALKRLGR